MAGAMCKANQRQSQARKRKAKQNYGYKRIRMHEIPLVCPSCKATKVVPSADAYRKGGNVCFKCSTEEKTVKYQFNVPKFPQVQLQKR